MYILVCNFLYFRHEDETMIYYFSPEYVVS
jgi:hypothetical protein